MTAIDTLATLYPREVDPPQELRRSLTFLDAETDPETVVRAGYGLGILGFAWTLCLWVLFDPGYLGVLVLVALTLSAVHAVQAAPGVLALARRTRALGQTPDLVARAVLSMRLAPAPERAAAFAATAGDGPLAESLARHVRSAKATGADALETFGAEWDRWYPELGRSLGLVSAAGEMTPDDRQRTLDRALTVVLDGTRSQMQSFAAGIQRPVTALYAFGVLLPTALVALLPAASAAGVGVTTATVVVLYDVLLPLGLVAGAVWLVVRRPVAFPPPDVDRDHPDVEGSWQRSVAVGVATAGLAWIVAARLLPGWGPPVVSLGLCVGVSLWLFYRPVVAVYDRIRDVESGLTDALALVGRRVANGVSVESAIEETATELDGEMGLVLDRAVSRQRQLKMGVHEALLGDRGALAAVPSPRVRGSMAVLGLAAREGQPAGSALVALAGHVEDLREVERHSRHALESVCGTLRTTGGLFGPIVAGATVALADALADVSALPGSGQSLPGLGLAVGGYVLASAVVLPALAISLQYGFDRALVGYHVGRALVCATVVYLAAYLLVAGLA